MILNEEQAKTKWCPFVRFHGTPSDDCIPNRTESLTDSTRCIGSSCMAWEWRGQEVETADCLKMMEKPKGDGWECTLPETGREKFEIKSQWSRRNPDRQGCCGLAVRW